MNDLHNVREEVLEHIWRLEEQGQATHALLVESVTAAGQEGALDELRRLEADGLVRETDGALRLSREGHGLARHVVRCNRLAALLLTDLLELPRSLVETHACRLEHAINPLLADRICTLLGHPPTAPDGSPIPPGECCREGAMGVTPAVHPLTRLAPGARGRITFIRPKSAERLNQLSSLGLIPGMELRLSQRLPSVVVQVAESTLALESDVAEDIYVKPL